MRRADQRILFLVLTCSVGACSGAGDEGGDGEGADELELWPIPSYGASGSKPTPRDSGMDAGASGDGGTSAMDSGPPTPPDLSLQVFDPNQIYLLGTLSEGTCERDGIASVFDPNRVAVGFDCNADTNRAQIRTSDGRLLYTNHSTSSPAGVRVFSCDGCIPDASASSYPAQPEANDELIARRCGGDAGSWLLPSFRLLPDSGVAQLCGSRWVDELGQTVVTSQQTILVFGHAGTALLADAVLDLHDAAVRPVDFPGGFRAYRVREDGYWVVPVSSSGSPDTLWLVDFDGGTSLVGSYAPSPVRQTAFSQVKLDGQGALFQVATESTASFHSTIIRRTLDGGSDVVYSEGSEPRLKIHISSLVTGP